jgi:hypothetical protein
VEERLIVWQLNIPDEDEDLGLYRTAERAKRYVGDFEADENVEWKVRSVPGVTPDGWYCETDDGEIWYEIVPIEVQG